MIGYPSGQDGMILLARDCPFCSRDNISPKSKRVHDSFLSQNIFRYSKNIFCDFSVGMELENVKIETRHHFSIQLASFSVLFMPYNKSFIDQASSVKMAGYWDLQIEVENSANIQPSWPRVGQ